LFHELLLGLHAVRIEVVVGRFRAIRVHEYMPSLFALLKYLRVVGDMLRVVLVVVGQGFLFCRGWKLRQRGQHMLLVATLRLQVVQLELRSSGFAQLWKLGRGRFELKCQDTFTRRLSLFGLYRLVLLSNSQSYLSRTAHRVEVVGVH
jgi:hypothetical protein